MIRVGASNTTALPCHSARVSRPSRVVSRSTKRLDGVRATARERAGRPDAAHYADLVARSLPCHSIMVAERLSLPRHSLRLISPYGSCPSPRTASFLRWRRAAAQRKYARLTQSAAAASVGFIGPPVPHRQQGACPERLRRTRTAEVSARIGQAPGAVRENSGSRPVADRFVGARLKASSRSSVFAPGRRGRRNCRRSAGEEAVDAVLARAHRRRTRRDDGAARRGARRAQPQTAHAVVGVAIEDQHPQPRVGRARGASTSGSC